MMMRSPKNKQINNRSDGMMSDKQVDCNERNNVNNTNVNTYNNSSDSQFVFAAIENSDANIPTVRSNFGVVTTVTDSRITMEHSKSAQCFLTNNAGSKWTPSTVTNIPVVCSEILQVDDVNNVSRESVRNSRNRNEAVNTDESIQTERENQNISSYHNLMCEIEKLRQNQNSQNIIIRQLQNVQPKDTHHDEIINRLRKENEELRARINTQVYTNQLPVNTLTSNNQSSSISNAFMKEMRNVNIEVPCPKFGTSLTDNPIEFLIKFDQFCQLKGIDDAVKVMVVNNCLEGRARVWAESQCYLHFDEFKSMFLREFYSVAFQVRSRNSWLQRRFTQSDGLLQTYFFDQVKNARYFSPPYTTYELHYNIVQQLPGRVRDALAAVDYSNIHTIMQVLDYFDGQGRVLDTERKPSYYGQLTKGHAQNMRTQQMTMDVRPEYNRKNKRFNGNLPRSADFNDKIALHPEPSAATVSQTRTSNADSQVNVKDRNSSLLPDTRIPPPPIIGTGQDECVSQNLN